MIDLLIFEIKSDADWFFKRSRGKNTSGAIPAIKKAYLLKTAKTLHLLN